MERAVCAKPGGAQRLRGTRGGLGGGAMQEGARAGGLGGRGEDPVFTAVSVREGLPKFLCSLFPRKTPPGQSAGAF